MKITAAPWLTLCIAISQVSSQSVALEKASNKFANNLYQELAKKPGNVLVCPLSLDVALALVNEGAGGQTRTQLTKVLGLGSADDKLGYKALIKSVKGKHFKMLTKLYVHYAFPAQKMFTDSAREYFNSYVEFTDLSDQQAAANRINNDVEEATNGKIHDLVNPDSLGPLARLVVVNAVHFQASWKDFFPPAEDGFFRTSNNNKVKTKMMTHDRTYEYKEDFNLRAKVLKIDYAESDYSMIFILPVKEYGLHEVETRLAQSTLDDVLEGLHDKMVRVSIPKFTVETTLNLENVLTKMGAGDMFIPGKADLSGISNGKGFFVNSVVQKTFITVHENGTEAAAASALTASFRSYQKPYFFIADHPFYFMLTNNRVVAFQGRFVQPSTSV